MFRGRTTHTTVSTSSSSSPSLPTATTYGTNLRHNSNILPALRTTNTPASSWFHTTSSSWRRRQNQHRRRRSSHQQRKTSREKSAFNRLHPQTNTNSRQNQNKNQQQQKNDEKETSTEERERQMEEREFMRLLRMTQEKDADERFKKMGFKLPKHGMFYVDEHVSEEMRKMEKDAYAEEGSFYGGSHIDNPEDRRMLDALRRDPQRALFKSEAVRSLRVFLQETGETEDGLAAKYHQRPQAFAHQDIVDYTPEDWKIMELEYYKITQGIKDEQEMEDAVDRELAEDTAEEEPDWELIEGMSPQLKGLRETMEHTNADAGPTFGPKQKASLRAKLEHLKELERSIAGQTTRGRETKPNIDPETRKQMEEELNTLEDMLTSGTLRQRLEKEGGDFEEIQDRLSRMGDESENLTERLFNNEELLSAMGMDQEEMSVWTRGHSRNNNNNNNNNKRYKK